MTGRSLPEWIGATPDTPVPPRVRRRVFDRHGGICHISKRLIRPGDDWECDHVKALIEGGQNRESNLAPALKDKHREKTTVEVERRAKADRTRLKHIGAWPASPFKIRSRGFPNRTPPVGEAGS